MQVFRHHAGSSRSEVFTADTGGPQRKRWRRRNRRHPDKSSREVNGREPEASGANDTPDHPPQTREYPSSSL